MTEAELMRAAEQSIARNHRIRPDRRKADVPGWVLDPNIYREPCPWVRVELPDATFFPYLKFCGCETTKDSPGPRFRPIFGPPIPRRVQDVAEMNGETWVDGGEEILVASGQCPACMTIYWGSTGVGPIR